MLKRFTQNYKAAKQFLSDDIVGRPVMHKVAALRLAVLVTKEGYEMKGDQK